MRLSQLTYFFSPSPNLVSYVEISKTLIVNDSLIRRYVYLYVAV